MQINPVRWLAGVVLLVILLLAAGAALAQDAAPITTENARLVSLARETTIDSLLWALAVSPGGLVATAGGDDAPGPHPIYLWDALTGAMRDTLPGHEGQIRALAFSPDGARLASGGLDGTLRLWDIDTGDLLLQVDGRNVWSVAFSPDGALLVAGRGTTTPGSAVLEVVDSETGAAVGTLSLDESLWPPFAVAFGPDDGRVLTGGYDGNLLLWDLQTDGVDIIPIIPKSNYPMWTAVYSTDGALIASAVGFVAPVGNTIHLADVAALRAGPPLLTGHERLVLGLSFAADGGLLASAGEDGTVRLWDVDQRRELAALAHGDIVLGVGFAADDTLLVSASRSGLVRAWSAPG